MGGGNPPGVAGCVPGRGGAGAADALISQGALGDCTEGLPAAWPLGGCSRLGLLPGPEPCRGGVHCGKEGLQKRVCLGVSGLKI